MSNQGTKQYLVLIVVLYVVKYWAAAWKNDSMTSYLFTTNKWTISEFGDFGAPVDIVYDQNRNAVYTFHNNDTGDNKDGLLVSWDTKGNIEYSKNIVDHKFMKDANFLAESDTLITVLHNVGGYIVIWEVNTTEGSISSCKDDITLNSDITSAYG